MPRQNMTNIAIGSQSCVKRIDRSTGHAETDVNTFLFQDTDCGFCCAHPGHGTSPLEISDYLGRR
ncbi:hypothetical protein [Azospirillum sp. BE72]|uniref:hypothetical protein n=1 Tax=Azospirillum sp. BE72 TaxID=2817776 RepID=UPI002862FF19|nr:hypothetical protein [Azospirillum sp. BE72]MDR6773283.1 hypothetical protein [Azospirillum sp. BE72]